MLFSEPKIPQCGAASGEGRNFVWFQCSSASRKFLNSPFADTAIRRAGGFSALQRAENSSIELRSGSECERRMFQCSSASRKFLNGAVRGSAGARPEVSVLFSEPKIPQLYANIGDMYENMFQCSSASRKFLNPDARRPRGLACGFQCSSASRKFLNHPYQKRRFCEQKFQCSSASRKFLNAINGCLIRKSYPFQCSSASRKFLNS